MGSNVRKILTEQKNKKRRESENKKKALGPAFLIFFISYFILVAWYFLYVRNADTMFFLQDRGWWNSTTLFFKDCTSVPGGLLSWAGAYLTQYWHVLAHPALASHVLFGKAFIQGSECVELPALRPNGCFIVQHHTAWLLGLCPEGC